MFNNIRVLVVMILFAISVQVGTADAAPFTNGGFEDGSFNGWSVDSVNNWALVINSGSQYAGQYEAQLGTYGTFGTLSQSFDTTAGQNYSVSFWLANDLPETTNLFQALWNGTAQSITALNPTEASAYSQYQFTVTAADANSTLAFNFQNDPSVFHLDSVDVAPVPEPGTIVLFGAGMFGLCIFGKRRMNAMAV